MKRFITHLVTEKNVTASTQTQALSALLFVYKLYGIDLGNLDLLRARRSAYLPTVLDNEEAMRVIEQLDGQYKIMAQLFYGSGLRLLECLRLRVKDVDFVMQTISIRDTKSNRVELPYAYERKSPGAAVSWGWQYVFPAGGLSKDPRSGAVRRHHMYETTVQKRIKVAAKRAGIVKPVGPHTFRHSFATRLLEMGYDIRTIQELMGHKDVKTTMIYTHVSKRGSGIVSPLDSQGAVIKRRAGVEL